MKICGELSKEQEFSRVECEQSNWRKRKHDSLVLSRPIDADFVEKYNESLLQFSDLLCIDKLLKIFSFRFPLNIPQETRFLLAIRYFLNDTNSDKQDDDLMHVFAQLASNAVRGLISANERSLLLEFCAKFTANTPLKRLIVYLLP